MSESDSIEIEVITIMLFLNEYLYIPKESEDELCSAVTLYCRLDAEWQDLLQLIRPIDAELLDKTWHQAEEARQEMIKVIELFIRKIKGPNFFDDLLKTGDDTLN